MIGRVTGDGDITVVEGGLDATGEPNPGAREIARVPVRALAPEAVMVERLAAPPPRRRMAPAPGVPEPAGEDLPERGMDPGAVLLGLLGSPNLASRARVGAPDDRSAPGTSPSSAGTMGRLSSASREPGGRLSSRSAATPR